MAARSAKHIARPRLSRHDWVAAARSAFVEGGIGAVKVERLARAMNVTIGSFYWPFSRRSELLDALLDDWGATNSKAMIDAATNEASPEDRFNAFLSVW